MQTDRWPDMTKVKLLTNLIFGHTDSPQSPVCVKPYIDTTQKIPHIGKFYKFAPHFYNFYE